MERPSFIWNPGAFGGLLTTHTTRNLCVNRPFVISDTGKERKVPVIAVFGASILLPGSPAQQAEARRREERDGRGGRGGKQKGDGRGQETEKRVEKGDRQGGGKCGKEKKTKKKATGEMRDAGV